MSRLITDSASPEWRIADLAKKVERLERALRTGGGEDSGWMRLGIEIAYTGGGNYATPYGGAGHSAIRRLSSGLVIGKGLVTTPAPGTPLFVIPAGFRPASTPGVHIVGAINSGTQDETFRIPTTAGAGGFATAWGVYPTYSYSWAGLSGVLWFAEQ